MKISKKSIFFIIIVLIISVFWYFWNADKKEKLENKELKKQEHIVKKWDIKNLVKANAKVQLANEQKLSFWKEWKIIEVFVKEWDQIQAWQILAELDLSTYENNIKQANLELENAILWLRKLEENDTSLREKQLITQINEGNKNYGLWKNEEILLKNNQETLLKQKNDQLNQLSKDYQIALKNLELTKSWVYIDTNFETEETLSKLTDRTQKIKSIINSLNTNIWDLKLIVESIDEIIWVSKKFNNQDYEKYDWFLWAKNTYIKEETKKNVIDSYSLIEKYKNIFNTVSTENTDKEIYDIIEEFYKETELIVKLCDNSIETLDASIVSLWSLTQEMINNFKEKIKSIRANVLNTRLNLDNLSSSINYLQSKQIQEDKLDLSLEGKNLNYEKQAAFVEKQKNDIEIFKQELEDLKNSQKNELDRKISQNNSILENINLLEAELKDLRDWADKIDLNRQRILIKQAELNLEKTKDQKEDYQIIADFDWRVRSIDIKKWEQYKINDAKYIVVENPDLIELKMQINQIDIVKVKEKSPVEITFDAYPEKIIYAKVTDRNVNPEDNWRGWIYYEASIIIDKQNLEILAWMTALVSIITDEAKNIIVIPSLSVVKKWEKIFVEKKIWDKFKLTEIEIWIKNNFLYEVKKWLNEWDIIKWSVLDEKILDEMWINKEESFNFW